MHQGGREKWNEMGAKVFQFPNPRNLGHRVGMGASGEIGCWCLLQAAGGGESPAGPCQRGEDGEPSRTGPSLGVSQPRSGSLSWPFSQFQLAFASPIPLLSHALS